jgi:hypothetical protein
LSFGDAGSSKRRRVVLAKARFRIGAGKTKAVKLRLGSRKLDFLKRNRRARRVAAIAGVRDAAGNRRTVRKGLTAILKRRGGSR